jgi:hypothetical protein
MKKVTAHRLIFCTAALFLAFSANADAPRVVNVTTDSAPGWIPSIEQSAQAERAARAYLAAEDSGDADAAYKFFASVNKSRMKAVISRSCAKRPIS